MPLQNRVTPFSEIVSDASRGLFMGNRGCLHDAQRTLVRQTCAELRWIICQTQFRGRRRVLMSPGQYTELFFLDEPTALAAGHRPCAECRHPAYRAFKRAWIAGNPKFGLQESSPVRELDRRLHADRRLPDGTQRLYRDRLANLPPGTMFAHPDRGSACLWWEGRTFAWTFAGYHSAPEVAASLEVDVLTPRSTVHALQSGYRPVVDDARFRDGLR